MLAERCPSLHDCAQDAFCQHPPTSGSVAESLRAELVGNGKGTNLSKVLGEPRLRHVLLLGIPDDLELLCQREARLGETRSRVAQAGLRGPFVLRHDLPGPVQLTQGYS